MSGYSRQSSFVDGATIFADEFSAEFNQLVNTFNNTTGHAHDGTANEGPVIGLIGDAGESVPNNKISVDTADNSLKFFVEVASAPEEQFKVKEGVILPTLTDDMSIGTDLLKFANAFFSGDVKTIDLLTSYIKANDGTASITVQDVTGNVTLASDLEVGNDLTITNDVSVSGDITVVGTVDGRDVSVDGTKLDTVETNADVTDTSNVTAAGAVMDSELTNESAVKAIDQDLTTTSDVTFNTVDGRDLSIDGTKLDTIESNSDVTDTTNVTAAGAVMDFELADEASVKAIDQGLSTTDSPTFVAVSGDGSNLTDLDLSPNNLNEISDVGTGTPSEGYLLVSRSGIWTPEAPTGSFASSAQGALADSALQDASDFATAAQGILADSALQDDSVFATSAQGDLADSALQPTDSSAQGQLQFVSTTELEFVPKNGNGITIEGVRYGLPIAGISLSNASLSSNTVYNVYAFDDGGTTTLVASTTATAVDTTAGNVGVVIEAGDATRTYVGRVYVSAVGEFTEGQVESHFNPPARPRRLHFRQEAASGTGSGGGTSLNGTWVQRTLNTEKANEIIGATVSSNVVTLPAGDYRVKARANLYKTGESKIRLYDNDSSASIIDGEQLWVDAGSSGNAFLQVSGNFTLIAETDIELQTRGTAGQSNNGMGRVTGSGVEVYTDFIVEELT